MKTRAFFLHPPSCLRRNAFPWLWPVLCLATTIQLSAATRIWTGGSATSGNWSTAANWDGGVVPVAGDVLNFVDTGARKTSNTNNFPAGRTFSTINVFGGGYRLRGNSVTITNYVTAGNPAGVNQIDLDLIAAGPGVGITLRSFDSGAQLTLTGDINLNARTLTTEGPGDFIITGVISGTGGLRKDNTGDLSLSGLGANTFTGTTVVSAGLLRLNRYNLVGLNQVGTVAIPGDLIIGDFVSTLIGRIAVLDRDNQIANTSTVSVYATGSLELSDESDTIGELRLRGGTVTTGAGVLNVDGGIYASQPSSVSKDSTIGGRLNLGVRGDGAQIVDVAIGAQLNITAQVSGVSTTDLIKTNFGNLFLTESNIFAGDVEIKAGIVTITDGHALGTTNGVTRLMGGRLHLNAAPAGIGVPEQLEVAGADVSDNVLRLSTGNGASWLGSVRLDRNLLFDVITNAALTVVGQISGPAGWMKFGPGTLQFKTAYTNDYEGQSQVNHGTFIMDGIFSQPVVPGHLFIAPIVNGTARASAIKHNQIADTASVSIFENGRLDLFGVNDTIGALSLLHGGTVETGSGTLTVNGSIRSERQLSAVEPSSIHGQLSLGGSQRTIHAFDSPHTVNLLITAVISDGGAAAGFNKEGAGGVQLTGANTFSGPASVTEGTLIVSHPDALGSPAAGTTVSGTNGAKIVLQASGGNIVTMEPLTLNSTGPGSPVVLENFTGNNHWNGPIVLLAPENVINVPSIPRPLSLGGTISGPGGLTKVGPGILTLDGLTTNTFTGLTFVSAGDLILDKPTTESIHGELIIGDGLGGANADRLIVRGLGDEIWNGSRVVINSSGQLILDSVLDLVGSIEGAGNIFLQNPASGLIVGRNDLSTTFDGVISGAGGFEKVGAGTLTLNGNHNYTGQSGVPEGTLIVNGSIASSSVIQLNRPLIVVTNTPPGILAGRGFVPTTLPYPDGTISPGTSPGRLTVQGHANLANTILRLELNGTTPGTSYDQLRVNGPVTLANTRLELTLGFTPVIDDSFMLIQNDGNDPVQGTFAGIPQGSYFSAGGMTFYIEYNAGDDDNDVVITRVATPPSNISSITPKEEKMVIQGQGVPGLSYVLEFAPQLSTPIPWTPVATNTANALGIYEFIDAYSDNGNPLHPQRFYRVR